VGFGQTLQELVEEAAVELTWIDSTDTIDWEALSNLYRIAPLGEKKPADLAISFGNSRFVCFAFDGAELVGAGRALADGIDCSYICDVAVHPAYQGLGIGKELVSRLVERSRGHRKIILYAAPGKEAFYRKLGFGRMTTAMAIFQNQAHARASGLVEDEPTG
jgi:ribosomal protein S18 acetylase RimI-like enzyme